MTPIGAPKKTKGEEEREEKEAVETARSRKPAAGNDPTENRKKGPRTDEDSIMKLLTSRSNSQRQQIKAAYKTLHGKVRTQPQQQPQHTNKTTTKTNHKTTTRQTTNHNTTKTNPRRQPQHNTNTTSIGTTQQQQTQPQDKTKTTRKPQEQTGHTKQ
ncbi:unnamed protein product [Coregonus sp. 'balchen']|nr:unnamed protein product [Coregonus sp. 'balchen']